MTKGTRQQAIGTTRSLQARALRPDQGTWQMRRFLRVLFALAIACWLLPIASAHAADWLHWRGPEHNGVARDTGLPDKWSPEQPGENNLLWKQPIGARSTPVVCKGHVYLISDAEPNTVKEQERVTCFDAKTGKILWEHRFNLFHTDIVTNRVGWANLAADEETGNVYAHGVQGLFFCFAPDGKVLWSKSLTEEYGRVTGYGGRVTSPIVDEDKVIIHFLSSNWGDQARGGHRFLALDKKTGEVIWWSEPGGQPLDTIQSTPIIAVINGERLLIGGGADGAVHAMQARTGKKVWSYHVSRRGLNVSPVASGNKVFISQSEENLEGTEMGGVYCFDASQVSNGQPKLVWQRLGIRAGYASPIVDKDRLYVPDNGAKIHCLNIEDGSTIWEFKYGTEAKASPVLADGKIYVGEVASKFHVLQPGDKSCKPLSVVRFPAGPDGENYEINCSPAIADGRIYFATIAEFYCIGNEKGKAPGAIPSLGKEAPVDANAKPATVQIVPADVQLPPGSTVSFKARLYDDKGRLLKETQAEWSLPAPTPPPAPPGGTPPAAPPPLRGKIGADGKLDIAKEVPAQAGYVQGKVGNLTSRARVRVYPVLPINLDFDKLPTGGVPSGWVNTGGKFAIFEANNGKALKKLANNPNSLLARANAYLSTPSLKDYTIEADLLGKQKDKFLPDMGVVNCRYSLTLDGNSKTKRLLLRTWEARKAPGEEIPGRINAKVDFPWKPDVWYHFKLKVSVEGDKAILLGKVWPRDEKEPAEWTIKVEDPIPNLEGSPALYGYAYGIPGSVEEARQHPGAEVYYDNLKVTPNR